MGARPTTPIVPLPRDVVRFWKYVERAGDDECWLWKASRRNFGYGQLGIYRDGRQFVVLASRFSWALHHGEIPDGLQVLHKCDNPPCVNPNHLFLGTTQDNTNDARWKGRLYTTAPDLTLEQIADVRARYQAGESRAAIGRRYGTTAVHVEKLTRGRHARRPTRWRRSPVSRPTVSKATKYTAHLFTHPAAAPLVKKATEAVFGLASDLGLTCCELAGRAGTSRQHVDQSKKHGVKTLKALAVYADALGCDVVLELRPRAVSQEGAA